MEPNPKISENILRSTPRVPGFEFLPCFWLILRFDSCVPAYCVDYKHIIKQRNFLIFKNMPHHFFTSLPNGHTVRLFYFPDLCVDFQRLAKSEKNGDSPFATISDADSLNLRQILRLPRVRDTWIGKVITAWRKRTCENTLWNSSWFLQIWCP